MKFNVNQQDIQKSLNYCQGVIEKKSTLPILSNVLLDASNSTLTITATDLDIIYSEVISLQELKKEGSTTTSASILYDILRKLEPNAKIEFSYFPLFFTYADSDRLSYSYECELEDFYFFVWNHVSME